MRDDSGGHRRGKGGGGPNAPKGPGKLRQPGAANGKRGVGQGDRPTGTSERHGQFHDRPQNRPQKWGQNRARGRAPVPDRLLLYGLHTVRHAIENPRRTKYRLHVSRNALARLDLPHALLQGLELVEAEPRALDRMVGADAVHQGAILEAAPLEPRPLAELGESPLLLVLDQVTDPHNVGAIMRSAVAFGAGALITTARHSPAETGVLAKSASGALDMIDHIAVRNLSGCLEELADLGYLTVGLDSAGPATLEESLGGTARIALVLGAEGKGLREKTRETCARLARIDMPGEIKSLNVSNAAVLALYIARSALPK